MEMSAFTGGPQAVSMATSAASNTYQTSKVETRSLGNHDVPYLSSSWPQGTSKKDKGTRKAAIGEEEEKTVHLGTLTTECL